MKISDQKPVVPPRSEQVGPRDGAGVSGGAGFSERLEDPQGAQGVQGAEGAEGAKEAELSKDVGGVGGTEPSGDLDLLAARVERGELRVGEVVDLLVDRAVDSQVGSDAPAGLRDQVRALVREAVSEDPFIVSLMRRVGGAR